MQLRTLKLALAFATWPLIIAVAYHCNPQLTVVMTSGIGVMGSACWSVVTILDWFWDRQQRARSKD